MTNFDLKKLQERARRRLKLRKDPRFVRTVEVLQAHGLLLAPKGAELGPRNGRVTFEDVYFAGNLEPRIFEVLPALAYRRPKAIIDYWNMPDDLKRVITEIRHGQPVQVFHGIEAKNYMVWVDQLRRKDSHEITFRKDFRFSLKDIEQLKALKQKLGLRSETEVVRKAIWAL